MSAPHDSPALLIEHLGTVDRVVRLLGRRHGLRDEQVADCGSWVRLRLVEDDYAILRKFRGESSIGTYLTVVVTMLCRDYRVQQWGRWRPSATALSKGSIAVQLERLIHRDGNSLREAGNILRSASQTTHSDAELGRLLADLPARPPLRPMEVTPEEADQVATFAAPDEILADKERTQALGAMAQVLRQEMHLLPHEDRVMLELRYMQGLTIAEIARSLDVPQKPLYRRLERTIKQLRIKLRKRGIVAEGALATISESP